MQTIPVLVIVNLLGEFLPRFGVNLGNDSLTSFAQVVIAIGSGLWIYFHHKKVVASMKG